jgi:hypothetical protein
MSGSNTEVGPMLPPCEERLERIAELCFKMDRILQLAGTRSVTLGAPDMPRLTKKAVSRFVNLVYREATGQYEERASGPRDWEPRP